MRWGESVGKGAVRSQGILARPPTTPVTSRVRTEKGRDQWCALDRIQNQNWWGICHITLQEIYCTTVILPKWKVTRHGRREDGGYWDRNRNRHSCSQYEISGRLGKLEKFHNFNFCLVHHLGQLRQLTKLACLLLLYYFYSGRGLVLSSWQEDQNQSLLSNLGTWQLWNWRILEEWAVKRRNRQIRKGETKIIPY